MDITHAIHFDDLQAQRSNRSIPGYAQPKLACEISRIELGRRGTAAAWRKSTAFPFGALATAVRILIPAVRPYHHRPAYARAVQLDEGAPA